MTNDDHNMTLGTFRQLGEIEQINVLFEKGVYLDTRFDTVCEILLYQIDSFYVEVFYQEKLNTIKRLRSFENVDKLKSYLTKIDIDKLF